MIHPSHTTPDPENTRADRTLSMARVIRDRMKSGHLMDEIHDDLVPNYVSEQDFFLAWKAALVLLG